MIGVETKEQLDELESRESERVMAVDTIAGVIFDVGDEKYMLGNV